MPQPHQAYILALIQLAIFVYMSLYSGSTKHNFKHHLSSVPSMQAVDI